MSVEISTALSELYTEHVPAVDSLVIQDREVLEAVPLCAGLRVLQAILSAEIRCKG